MPRALVLFFALAAALLAQSPTRNVILTWEDTANPAGTTYTAYRADGPCTAAPAYAPLASGVSIKTYSDAGRNPGKYCYTVTATFAGEESEYAVPALAQVKPWKPTNLTIEVR